jgi:hypothetical protein
MHGVDAPPAIRIGTRTVLSLRCPKQHRVLRAQHVVAPRRGLNRFNILINYWSSLTRVYIPNSMYVLYHAHWMLRDQPESEKQVSRNVFEYYVPVSRERAMLISKLNR